jgi:hypothetical protein
MVRTRMGLAVAVMVVAGCDALNGLNITIDLGDGSLFIPRVVTLRVVNDAEFPVDTNVFVSEDDEFIFGLDETLLTLDTNLQNFGRLPAGETLDRAYDCDRIGSVMAADAELRTGMGISPNADTRIFLQGDDFVCGDTITIRFTGTIGSFGATISAGR